MKTTNFWEKELKDTPHKVDVRRLYKSNQTEVNVLTLNPGEQLIPHTTQVDALFFVLEGTPTIHIGDEVKMCDKYTLIESPANIIHHISNTTTELARVLIVKGPKQTFDID